MSKKSVAVLLPIAIIATMSAHSLSESNPPSSAAVVKNWDIVWRMRPNAERAELTVTKEIEIRDPAGFDQANQLISYYATDADLQEFEARTIQPDGTVVEVAPSMRHERPWLRDGQSEYRAVQITFPEVRPGSALFYRYTLRIGNAHPFLPLDGGWWEIQGVIPVRRATLTALVTDEDRYGAAERAGRAPVHDWCARVPAREFGYTGWTMTCTDVPAFVPEPDAPPDDDLRLRAFVYFPKTRESVSLLGLGQGLSRGLSHRLAVSKKIDDIAQQWWGSDLPLSQKLEAILAWVRENVALVYDASPTLDHVIERRSGTELERNLLAIALLRENGVPARPALLTDRSKRGFDRATPDVSGLDRLFISLSTTKGRKFFDVNCAFCVPGFPSWEYVGPESGGLDVELVTTWDHRNEMPSGQVDVLDDLPGPAAKYNSELRKRIVTLGPSGDARVKGSISWQMQQDVERRESWSRQTEAGRREDCLGNVAVDAVDAVVTTGDPFATEKNLGCTFEFALSGAAMVVGRSLLAPAIDDFSKALRLPPQETRVHPLRRRYGHAMQSETTYVLPEGARLVGAPVSAAIDGPGATFRAQWSRAEDGRSVVLRGVLIVENPELPAADFPAFREFAAAVRGWLRGGVEIEVQP